MIEIICACIAAGSAIIVAFIGRKNKIDRERSEARAFRREQESRISMSLMFATSKLCTATALAIKNGGDAGESLDEGLQAVHDAQQEYEAFLMETTAHQVAK